MENKKNAGPTPETELGKLIRDLLAEPFAVENQFGEMNLDQVGKALEEAREIGHEEGEAPRTAAGLASHENCVSIYCMILMELESQGASSPPEETLYELTHGRDSTILFEIPPREEPEIATPPPLERPAHVVDEAPVDEMMSDFPAPFFPGPESEQTSQAPPARGILEEFPPEEEPMVFPDERPLSAVGSVYEQEFKVLLPDLMSLKARDHLEIALYFQLIRGGSFPFAPENADRLSGQSFCFALEAECAAIIAPVISGFWSLREVATRALLDVANRKFELHPQLRTGLAELTKSHDEWVEAGEYPFSGTLGALRRILTAPQAENFHPSLCDVATLIFFFGQDLSVQGFSLKNQLGVGGLSPAEICEFTFRTLRTQGFQNRMLAANAEVTTAELDLLQTDLKCLLTFLPKFKLGGIRKLKAA